MSTSPTGVNIRTSQCNSDSKQQTIKYNINQLFLRNMKKVLLLGMATTALLATSCSNDEAVEIPSQKSAIGFSTFVDRPTRAGEAVTDINNDNLSSFRVWGLMYNNDTEGHLYAFDKVDVTANNNKWTYNPLVYWNNNYKYSFLAIAPTDRFAATETGNNPILVIQPTKVGEYGSIRFRNIGSAKADGATDLVVAVDGTYANSAISFTPTTDIDPIELTFKHMLSRVVFNFTNAMEDNSELIINAIEISNAWKEGTATINNTTGNIATPSWTVTSNNFGTLIFGPAKTNNTDNVIKAVTYTNGVAGTPVANDNIGITEERYIIPYNPTTGENTYTIKFTINRKQPSGLKTSYTKEATVSAPAATQDIPAGWQPGYSYIFSAELNSSNIGPDALKPIVFTGTVSDWIDVEDHPEVSNNNITNP